MHDFYYVPKEETRRVRDELFNIIYEVQDIVRKHFTFQFVPVGSCSRNMITCDRKSNIGFDFDFDLEIHDDDENYSAKEIRSIIRNAFDCAAPDYGYGYCEDSTRVLTIKKVNRDACRILHSCDFALVYHCADGNQQYIRFNKHNNNYTWEYQGKGVKPICPLRGISLTSVGSLHLFQKHF